MCVCESSLGRFSFQFNKKFGNMDWESFFPKRETDGANYGKMYLILNEFGNFLWHTLELEICHRFFYFAKFWKFEQDSTDTYMGGICAESTAEDV
jgi:hypothetical protein